ncbi:CD59 glycoprotein [Synchiropus picturatus]
MLRRCGILLLLCGLLTPGSGLRCYRCSDYSGRCENVQECTYEDACLSLSERGGRTVRQCVRYTECNVSRLTQMFPFISDFMFRCCSSNLCNSGHTLAKATPLLPLIGSLLVTLLCRS